jgi:hypothetical protein
MPGHKRLLRHRAKMQRKFEEGFKDSFWFNPLFQPSEPAPRFYDPLYLWFRDCYMLRGLHDGSNSHPEAPLAAQEAAAASFSGTPPSASGLQP